MEKTLIVTDARIFYGEPTSVENDNNICFLPNMNCIRQKVSGHCILRIDYSEHNCPYNKRK